MVLMVFYALVGLILGSFAGCLAYRLSTGESVTNPARSYCPKCRTLLHWYDNIPVLSYFVLRGKCRSCGEPISARYLFAELAMGCGGLILGGRQISMPGVVLGMTVLFILVVATAWVDTIGRLFNVGWAFVVGLLVVMALA